MYFFLWRAARIFVTASTNEGTPEVNRFSIGAMAAIVLAAFTTAAQAAPCMIVTLTGTQGGPSVFNGLAGAGTLVRYETRATLAVP